ncbi:MAG: bacterial regulatory helix-turn-helix, lysR family protein [Rhizobacter sp.]|nr:bacterial regulatory helix-turn-helix, lysR family protein [Rhizobacter sp.]
MTFPGLLDSHYLAAFLAVVEHGSLGRAAETLHVTQSALSRTLRRFELQIGAPLFERHSKGMALTAIGAALHPHAQALQRGARHATEEINALRGLAKGTIRVGAVGSIASLTLPLAVGRVLRQWPNLRVEIIEGVWDRLADALMRHEIDLALGVALFESPEIAPIPDCAWHDRSYVVAAVTHPLRAKKRLRLADTLGFQWAVPPRGTAPFEQVMQLFADRGLPAPTVAVETRSITALKSLITRAGFLGWMAEPIYDAERAAGLIEALPIPGVELARQLGAFCRRDGILPTPALRLLDELRLIAAEGA